MIVIPDHSCILLRVKCSHPALVLDWQVGAHQEAAQQLLKAGSAAAAAAALRSPEHAPKLVALRDILNQCGIVSEGPGGGAGGAGEGGGELGGGGADSGHRLLVFAQLKVCCALAGMAEGEVWGGGRGRAQEGSLIRRAVAVVWRCGERQASSRLAGLTLLFIAQPHILAAPPPTTTPHARTIIIKLPSSSSLSCTLFTFHNNSHLTNSTLSPIPTTGHARPCGV